MTLEVHRYPGGSVKSILTECPFCGFEFGRGRSRERHFETEHGPEVIGK